MNQTNIDALRVKLEAAKASLNTALAATTPAWDAVNAAWKAAHAGGIATEAVAAHDAAMKTPEGIAAYEAAREEANKASKAATKAKAAVTRATSALAIAETGVDPRVAYRPKKYKAVLADGTVVATRKSPRTYTHAIVVPSKDGKGYWCEGWAGSESLAADRVRRLIGWGNKAIAVPAIVVA